MVRQWIIIGLAELKQIIMTDRDMDNQLQDVQKSVENFVDDLRGLISDLRGERDIGRSSVRL
jgi:signal transduction histidine kinase